MSKTNTYKFIHLLPLIAERFLVEINERDALDSPLYHRLLQYANVPSHLNAIVMRRGLVFDEVIFTGEKPDVAVIYSGALSTTTQKPIELLFATDCKKVLAVTYGVPEGLGVLEVINIPASIALQEISGVEHGIGGPTIVVHMDAPQPQPYWGIAQFRSEDIPRLYKTLDILL